MNINFSGLTKEYAGKTIFENLKGQINDGDKIGLIGANGAGKTTLARILAGEEVKDAGEIDYSPSYLKILYIQQYPEFDKGITVYEDILGFISRWNEDKNRKNPSEIATVAKTVLNKVGLEEKFWHRTALSLSGGEKTKLALSRMFAVDFDLLVLDEPTNHLDIGSCEWLEDFIKNLDKPMLIISHDRFFLDRTVNRIWDLSSRGLKVYEGNYTQYKANREIEIKSITRIYLKQQDRIQQLKAMIDEREKWFHRAHKSAGQNDFYRSKAKKQASAMKAKKTQLERLESEKVERPPKELSPAFDVINKYTAGRKFPRFLIQGRNISKSFGKNAVLDKISFDVGRGDKIAVIGANGSGKTTLLKIVNGVYNDYEGTLNISPQVKIGYFSQELENLDFEATVLDAVLCGEATIQEARLLLASLLFRGDDVYMKVAGLSMGEKGRVAFAKLILSGANLLVLDEPTNYMDIQSRENIEEALEQFEGSVLFVSHDRYFINRLAKRIFHLKNGKLYIFDGNYENYLLRMDNQKAENNGEKLYKDLQESIMKLELELAYLSGKLDQAQDEEEKEALNRRYLELARELNQKKYRLE